MFYFVCIFYCINYKYILSSILILLFPYLAMQQLTAKHLNDHSS